jgi:hypothetical protein
LLPIKYYSSGSQADFLYNPDSRKPWLGEKTLQRVPSCNIQERVIQRKYRNIIDPTISLDALFKVLIDFCHELEGLMGISLVVLA